MLLRRHHRARDGRQTTSAQTAPEAEVEAAPEPQVELEATDAEQAEVEADLDAANVDPDELDDEALEALTAPDTDDEPQGDEPAEKPKRNRK